MGEEREGTSYLLALRQHWMYIVATVVVAIAGAVAYTAVAAKQYEASTDVLVSPVGSDTLVGLPLFRVSVFGRSVVTAARLVQSPQVAARVRKSLHLEIPPSAVSRLITVTPQQQSDILTISARSGSPDKAAQIANAFAQAFVAERTARFQHDLRNIVASLSRRLHALNNVPGSAETAALATQIASYQALYGDADPTLQIASAAIPPSKPASPRTLVALAVAGMLGLLLGVGVAVAREIWNPVITSVDSFASQDGRRVLSRIARPTDNDVRTALSDPQRLRPAIKSSLRTLWANLGAPSSQSVGRTFVITSAAADDGHAAIAALLAATFARAGMSVTLMDADLERGPLAEMVDGDGVLSLGRFLAAERTPPAALSGNRSIVTPQRLQVLLAHPGDQELADFLAPQPLSALVAELRRDNDAVVVSAPPLPAAETSVLTGLADSVIITVEVGRTRRKALTQLRHSLAEGGVVPLGFVVIERRPFLVRISWMSPNRLSQRLWG
jgi:capsular polysaccharide biosynthesis protein/Mrp family chromosome partitioning ATPase